MRNGRPREWFQSTRPRGARQEKDELGVRIAIVSIHAPARGATFSCFIICFIVCVSIHAPARGATRDSQARIDSKNEFQSTRPRGARRKRGVVDAVLDGFQSTRPRGARPIVSYNVFSKSKVSIHAPARGATWKRVSEKRNGLVSIHAPARGATFTRITSNYFDVVSIHAPARGATRDSQSRIDP